MEIGTRTCLPDHFVETDTIIYISIYILICLYASIHHIHIRLHIHIYIYLCVYVYTLKRTKQQSFQTPRRKELYSQTLEGCFSQ